MADPPWSYNDQALAGNRGASQKYEVLPIHTVKNMPVGKLAKDDSFLFLWTTFPMINEALQVMKAWGFEYRTVAFIWDKMNHNPGKYTLSNCELVLLFKHGRIPMPRGARNIQQLIRSPRREHSQKPIEVKDAIKKMFPTQKRIELFAREKTRGWSTWGLDLIQKKDFQSDLTDF